jgi:hypothetical protein
MHTNNGLYLCKLDYQQGQRGINKFKPPFMYLFELMFLAAYTVYRKSEDNIPVEKAICLIGLSQFGILFLLTIILNKIFAFNLPLSRTHFIVIIIFTMLFLFGVNSYYFNKKRVEQISKKFELFSGPKKGLIALLTLLMIILPFIIALKINGSL